MTKSQLEALLEYIDITAAFWTVDSGRPSQLLGNLMKIKEQQLRREFLNTPEDT